MSKTTKSTKRTKKTTKNNTKKAKAQNNGLRYEVKLTLLLAATVFIFLAMFSNATSFVGAWIRDALTGLFSYYAFVFPLFAFACIFVSINQNLAAYRWRVYFSSVLISLASILALGLMMAKDNQADIFAPGGIVNSYLSGQQLTSLGVIGQLIFAIVNGAIGHWGTVVVICTALMLFCIFTLGITPTKIGKSMGRSASATGKKISETGGKIGESIKVSVEQIKEERANADKQRDKKRLIDLVKAADFAEAESAADESLTAVDAVDEDIVKDTKIVDDSGVADYGSITIIDYDDQRKPFNPVEAFDKVDESVDEYVDEIAPEAVAESQKPGVAAIKDLKTIKKENAVISSAEVDAVESKITEEVEKSYENYRIPPMNLLNYGSSGRSEKDNRDILAKAKLLEQTLADFKIDAHVVQVSKGPMITRFEIQPSPGVKVSKIVNLSDDIALSLAAISVRIVAPIPGKAAIGIEIPNQNTSLVTLRDVIESDLYDAAQSPICFGLGKDISGQPIVADLSKMPHLLIAGATGSGKSVCVNTIITSILYNAKPDEVKFLMIDPKVVELNVYNGIPHLILPVVTDPKKASIALNWAVQEMTERYKQFADNGVRDITSFNKRAESDEAMRVMPRIVVIIDELADLMMVAPNQVEDAICRLAQMARAAGIHLIVATQRPSVDVITGVIKANIPSRIAFAVSSQVDSRTIIDMAGAEKLLGKGDMLYYPVGKPKPLRVQGSFISEDEVETVVKHVIGQVDGELHYDDVSLDDIEHALATEEGDDIDELLANAIEFVVRSEKASTSLLQRQFRIGYNRAARMIDEMEVRGIIGPSRGSKPREVLLTWQEYETAAQ